MEAMSKHGLTGLIGILANRTILFRLHAPMDLETHCNPASDLLDEVKLNSRGELFISNW